MPFEIDARHEWADADDIKVAGEKVPACGDGSWTPPEESVIGYVRKRGNRQEAACGELSLPSGAKVPVGDASDGKGALWKHADWIAVADGDRRGFAEVRALRKWPLVPLAAVLVAATLAGTLSASGPAGTDASPLLPGQAATQADGGSRPQAQLSYAAYLSSPDATWQAGSLEQTVRLALPATSSYTDGEGNPVTVENPVLAAPSVWVDLDGDGSFGEGECVFNEPSYDDQGNVVDAGRALQPGYEVDSITLTREVPAGTYAARTLWTPVSAADGTPANPMSFSWNLTVQ